jgi:hypothetical protein
MLHFIFLILQIFGEGLYVLGIVTVLVNKMNRTKSSIPAYVFFWGSWENQITMKEGSSSDGE